MRGADLKVHMPLGCLRKGAGEGAGITEAGSRKLNACREASLRAWPEQPDSAEGI